METAIQLVEKTSKGSPLPGFTPYLDKKKKCMLFFALLKYYLFNMNKIKRSMYNWNRKEEKTRDYMQSDIRERFSDGIEAFLTPGNGKFDLEEVKLLFRDLFIDFYRFRNGKTELQSEERFAEIFYASVLSFVGNPAIENSLAPLMKEGLDKWNGGGSSIKSIHAAIGAVEKVVDQGLEKAGIIDKKERDAFRERHILELVCEVFEPAQVQV